MLLPLLPPPLADSNDDDSSDCDTCAPAAKGLRDAGRPNTEEPEALALTLAVAPEPKAVEECARVNPNGLAAAEPAGSLWPLALRLARIFSGANTLSA